MRRSTKSTEVRKAELGREVNAIPAVGAIRRRMANFPPLSTAISKTAISTFESRNYRAKGRGILRQTASVRSHLL